MNQFEARLASLDDEWDTAPADTGQGPPPPGVYQARVEKLLLEVNERTDHVQLKTVLEIAHGEQEGRTAICWHDLEDPDRFRWAKSHLVNLGLDPGPLSTLEGRLPAALDSVVEINVKQSTATDSEGRRYTNTYVNKLLEQGSGPALQAARSAKHDDDIPF